MYRKGRKRDRQDKIQKKGEKGINKIRYRKKVKKA
jgi:hypothetical protein